jgi:pimeloyl-ACP methyl ester carboxylesterase
MTQRRTLVLMPGFDGTGKLFDPIIPLLEPHFDLKVITYPDLDSFNDYIDCAYRQLPQIPGYSLLAESFSGPVALALMSQLPDQIGPSVLCSTFCRSPLHTMTQMLNQIPDQMFSLGALASFCFDVDELIDMDFTDTQPIPVNVTSQLDGTVLKHRISVLSRIDVSAMLPDIQTSILYLQGTHDKIVTQSHAQMVAQLLPNVHRVNLDGPHMLLQTHPHLCVDLMINHFSKKQA